MTRRDIRGKDPNFTCVHGDATLDFFNALATVMKKNFPFPKYSNLDDEFKLAEEF